MKIEGNGTQQIESKRLVKAARDFESMLLNQMLSPLTKEEGDNNDGANGQVRQTAVQAIADAMARSGGIGLSRLLVAQLQQNSVDGARGATH